MNVKKLFLAAAACLAAAAFSAFGASCPAASASGTPGPAASASGVPGPAAAASGTPSPAASGSGVLGPATAASGVPGPAKARTVWTSADVVEIIGKVNSRWQADHQAEVSPIWDNAVYHTGNMETYFLTGNADYMDYSLRWAERNEWMGAKGKDPSEWRFSPYGESDEFVLFGDLQICFQVYMDLYRVLPDERRIARTKEVMEYQISTDENGYWWWCDALYMAMPVMTKLYTLTGNEKLLYKMYDYIKYTDSIMYDDKEHLYHRDWKYVWPEHKTANGKKDFWARGDGWVLAGLAKVLQDLPVDFEHYDFFLGKFRDMASAVAVLQQPEGYWTRSLIDPEFAPGPETSGTALFMYGLTWGINNGYLDRDVYLPVIEKAWDYLSGIALQKDGTVGYVQPIGEQAIPGQVVDESSTANFGVGVYLLAACEYARLLMASEASTSSGAAVSSGAFAPGISGATDRAWWCRLAYDMAAPVLSNMAKGELKKNMLVEVSPAWDGRPVDVAYMETFGRLMAGIAPWLALPDDDTEEGRMRGQLRQWALASYANAVDPASPDRLSWEGHGQALVDAAYIAESFLRAYDALWVPLDETVKARYIEVFKGLRREDPPYTNWLLFSSVIESFLAKVGGGYDLYRVNSAIRKVEEWYAGDGWYSDGPDFAFDYYTSYVFHPMYLETLQAMMDAGVYSRIDYRKYYDRELVRAQKFSVILERFISPEGTFPVFGRSATYRMAAMQPLALMAWYDELPAGVTRAQVRCALTAVMKRMFTPSSAAPASGTASASGTTALTLGAASGATSSGASGTALASGTSVWNNFNDSGFLTIGFCGSQPNIADWYTNNGSLYMTSLAFLPLGLPASDPFWTDAPQPWTSVKAWSGQPFPKDHVWKDTITTRDRY